jgi:hypothetical protein
VENIFLFDVRLSACGEIRMMEAVCSPETSVSFYQTTQGYISEDSAHHRTGKTEVRDITFLASINLYGVFETFRYSKYFKVRNVQAGFRAHLTPYSMDKGAVSPGVKRPGA